MSAVTIIQLSEEDLSRLIVSASKEGAAMALAEAENQRKEHIEKRYSSGKEICKKFGISIQTLIRWRNSGKVPGYRQGGRVFYLAGEVENFIKNGK
jgi:DNA repair ATPase RecN